MNKFSHQPVLLSEVLQAFDSLAISIIVDCTLGAGGHAKALLENHPEIQWYVGIDQDPEALKIAKKQLEPWSQKLLLVHGNFVDFSSILKQFSISSPNAILVDLGVSSMQLDQPERGFSFTHEGPLDMRMNPDQTLDAREIVNFWSEEQLGRIFREYGEEKQWRSAARAIVQARKSRAIETTQDLASILTPVLKRHPKKKINPLTLIFQALRICVNKELEVLEAFLTQAIDCLAPAGVLGIISFHSLEDRIVKTHLRFAASDKWDTSGIGGLFQDKEPLVKLITKKPIEANDEEIQKNPRSRSAKLRVVKKLEPSIMD